MFADGSSLGKAIEALIDCRTGTVTYIVVATSMAIGADEQLRAVSRDGVAFNCNSLTLRLTPDEFEALDVLKSDAWPARAVPVGPHHVTLGVK